MSPQTQLKLNTWQTWRNFKFLHMQWNFGFFHTIEAEKCEFSPNMEEFHISPQDRCEEMKKLPCFVALKSVLWRITLFLQNPFWARFTHFCVEKIEPKIGKNSKKGHIEDGNGAPKVILAVLPHMLRQTKIGPVAHPAKTQLWDWNIPSHSQPSPGTTIFQPSSRIQ